MPINFPTAPANGAEYSYLGKSWRFNGTGWALSNGKPYGREVLTANRTYYVATTGSNSNDGLTASTPFLTIQRAIDVIAATLDISGYIVTVQVANGTYTSSVVLKNVAGYTKPGDLIISGNVATPSNVVISTTSADAIAADSVYTCWDIKDLKLQTTTSGHGIICQRGATVRFGNLVFGSIVGTGVLCVDGSYVVALSSYSITGGSNQHIRSSCTSTVRVAAITVTITGTPAFANAFIVAEYNSAILASGLTFSGAATGTKYLCAVNGTIYTNFAGVNYFPGSVAGSTATGGQYI